jgi:RimJ/RimL family protein N-acetyltransferase
VIHGKKIRLRAAERDDLPRFVRWLNDPEVRHGLNRRFPLGIDEQTRLFEDNLRSEPALRWHALDLLDDADVASMNSSWRHVGAAGFHQVDWCGRSAEMGIFIGEKSVWNRGVGTDATRTLARWAFDSLNLNRVHLRVFDDNPRAIHCYERVGFVIEGRLRQERYHDGRHHDVLIMGLLRDELR